jgi:hypothetical protein
VSTLGQLVDESIEHGHALWNKWSKDPRVTWCCPGRHCYVKDLMPNEVNEFYSAMVYVLGNKCGWKKTHTGMVGRVPVVFTDMECVAMTKVYPPPSRPWEWCGKTHIFESWRQTEANARRRAVSFNIGDQVSFVHKDARVYGVVVGKNAKSAKVYVESQRQTWTCSYPLLEKE